MPACLGLSVGIVGAGTEIVSLARMVNSFDAEGSTDEERQIFLEDRIKPFFKDYEPALDQQVLAAMMQIAKERISAAYLPDEFANIDKKYKGDYKKYAADVFKKTKLLSYDNIVNFISDPKKNAKLKKDPAFALSLSSFVALIELKNHLNESADKITKGERLYLAGLMEMYPDKTFYSDANFTMRASYGSIGGIVRMMLPGITISQPKKVSWKSRIRLTMSSGYRKKSWIWYAAATLVSMPTKMEIFSFVS